MDQKSAVRWKFYDPGAGCALWRRPLPGLPFSWDCHFFWVLGIVYRAKTLDEKELAANLGVPYETYSRQSPFFAPSRGHVRGLETKGSAGRYIGATGNMNASWVARRFCSIFMGDQDLDFKGCVTASTVILLFAGGLEAVGFRPIRSSMCRNPARNLRSHANLHGCVAHATRNRAFVMVRRSAFHVVKWGSRCGRLLFQFIRGAGNG